MNKIRCLQAEDGECARLEARHPMKPFVPKWLHSLHSISLRLPFIAKIYGFTTRVSELVRAQTLLEDFGRRSWRHSWRTHLIALKWAVPTHRPFVKPWFKPAVFRRETNSKSKSRDWKRRLPADLAAVAVNHFWILFCEAQRKSLDQENELSQLREVPSQLRKGLGAKGLTKIQAQRQLEEQQREMEYLKEVQKRFEKQQLEVLRLEQAESWLASKKKGCSIVAWSQDPGNPTNYRHD